MFWLQLAGYYSFHSLYTTSNAPAISRRDINCPGMEKKKKTIKRSLTGYRASYPSNSINKDENFNFALRSSPSLSIEIKGTSPFLESNFRNIRRGCKFKLKLCAEYSVEVARRMWDSCVSGSRGRNRLLGLKNNNWIFRRLTWKPF